MIMSVLNTARLCEVIFSHKLWKVEEVHLAQRSQRSQRNTVIFCLLWMNLIFPQWHTFTLVCNNELCKHVSDMDSLYIIYDCVGHCSRICLWFPHAQVRFYAKRTTHKLIISWCYDYRNLGADSVAQRWRNGLPCDDPGFNSRSGRCIYRATRPSQGTVNGGAVSIWPRCRWDINTNKQ